MSDALREQIFNAIHAEPRPITQERAQEIGVNLLQDDFPKRKQWIEWMEHNGAQLVSMINGASQ